MTHGPGNQPGRTDASLDEVSLRRIAPDAAMADLCRGLAPSRSAAWALETALLDGYRLQFSKRPGGFDADGFTDRHRRTVEVRTGLPRDAGAAALARQLRRVLHDRTGVLAALDDLPVGQKLAGTALVAADAGAFLAHVSHQLAKAGESGPWAHCISGGTDALAFDAYLRGVRKGGERIGATMAFCALASSDAFLVAQESELAAMAETGDLHDGPGALSALSMRLEMASPAGTPYPERPFRFAVRDVSEAAKNRPHPAPRAFSAAA